MPVSFGQFVDRLIESRLMPKADVDAFVDALPALRRPKSGDQLARELVRQKKLTAFQAQRIYGGKGKSLVLGNYVVLDKLGQGGMGMVLKAQHRHMGRLVALKVLSPTMTKSPEAVRRFQREVQAAARLEHTNIVIAYDADEADGTHFLVMQYVAGKDLAELVKQKGPLPVEKALPCVIQAARGLEYAHAQGVVHRDIKPSNLLFDGEGTVKILDLGLARIESGDAEQDQLTSTGQIMGTVDFMAPEQAMSTKQADARSDIYSLGITLWYLLTGRAAYEGETAIQKLMSHQNAPIPSLREACPQASSELEAVFTKMVAKTPETRYQQMGDVITDLQLCLSGSAAPPSIGPTAGEDSQFSDFLRELEPTPEPMVITQPTAKKKTADSIELAPTVTTQSEEAGTDSETQRSLVGSRTRTATASVRLEHLKRRISNWIAYCPRSRFGMAYAAGGAIVLLLAAIVFFLQTEDADIRVQQGKKLIGQKKLPSSVAASAGTPSSTKAPPSAIAPFDTDQAKKHQQAWADYLGVAVERDFELPGGEKVTMLLIPPGEFMMGSSDEERQWALKLAKAGKENFAVARIPGEGPQHLVRITRPFYLGKFEVTQAQWEAVMGGNPSRFSGKPSHPVEQVDWDVIQTFLAKVDEHGKNQGVRFALPTEAQWEYACRAGTTTRWHSGDGEGPLPQYAWLKANADLTSHSVGKLKAGPWGLHDMHGNVMEWCADWYDVDYYKQSPTNDPNGPETGSNRVLRGGSWSYHERVCRSARRGIHSRGLPLQNVGFRLAGRIPHGLESTPSVSADAPPPAVTPFDAAQAKQHQHAWRRLQPSFSGLSINVSWGNRGTSLGPKGERFRIPSGGGDCAEVRIAENGRRSFATAFGPVGVSSAIFRSVTRANEHASILDFTRLPATPKVFTTSRSETSHSAKPQNDVKSGKLTPTRDPISPRKYFEKKDFPPVLANLG